MEEEEELIKKSNKLLQDIDEIFRTISFTNCEIKVHTYVTAISDVFIMVLLTLFCILSFILPSELSIILIVFPILMVIINMITRYFYEKIKSSISELENEIKNLEIKN